MFAYGATGAGKTHTMLGSQNDPGVMYRTMKELFKRMDDAKEEKEFAVAFSYLEVSIGFFIFTFIFTLLCCPCCLWNVVSYVVCLCNITVSSLDSQTCTEDFKL